MSAINKRLDALEAARRQGAINACCVPELMPPEAARRMLALILSIPAAAAIWAELMARGRFPGTDPETDWLFERMIENVKAAVPEGTRRRFTVYQPLETYRHARN